MKCREGPIRYSRGHVRCHWVEMHIIPTCLKVGVVADSIFPNGGKEVTCHRDGRHGYSWASQ